MVIDHDIYMMDLLADRLMVFDGEPAVHGRAGQPQPMRDGMNGSFANLEVTFRRDERTSRPRINKPTRSWIASRKARASTTTP